MVESRSRRDVVERPALDGLFLAAGDGHGIFGRQDRFFLDGHLFFFLEQWLLFLFQNDGRQGCRWSDNRLRGRRRGGDRQRRHWRCRSGHHDHGRSARSVLNRAAGSLIASHEYDGAKKAGPEPVTKQ